MGIQLLALVLATWLVLQTSAMTIADKWDVETLSKQLHDPSKELIDLECDACVVIVDTVQFLARRNASEDEIVTTITELCILLKLEHNLICIQGVQEFKVSTCMMIIYAPMSSLVAVG